MRGPAVLVEDLPEDAIAGPELEPDKRRFDVPERLRSAPSSTLKRGPMDASAPGRNEFARASISRAVARGAAPSERPPELPAFSRTDVTETVAAARPLPPKIETPDGPPAVARATVSKGTHGRFVPRVDAVEPERPRVQPDAPRASLSRARVDIDVPDRHAKVVRRSDVREAVTAADRPEPKTRDVGVQTITRARGRTPAGLPGRLQESFTRVAPRRLSSRLPGVSISRAGRLPDRSIAPSRGAAAVGRVRAVSGDTVFGVLKHSGDWNVTPRALNILARELPTRHPGFPMVPRVLPLKPLDDAIFECAVLYVTGRRSPVTTPADARRVATYLDRGGFLWVDDASPPGDNTFDRAARTWMTGLVPGAVLRRVPVSHELYSSSYDLVNGYARHTPPAGAWLRQGELTGLFDKTGRLMGLYSRNGYGRAIEIDPLERDVLTPPRGLTPRECREGALRLAVNVVVHALRASGQSVSSDPTERPDDDPATRYRYRGKPLEVDRAFLSAQAFREVRDGAPVTASGSSGILSLQIGSSEVDICGVTRSCPAHVAAARALVMDVTSALLSSAQLAVRLRSADGTAYESVPLYLRPGANENIRVPLDGVDFRSTKTGWKKYDTSLDRSAGFSSVSLILYGRDIAGALRVARWRVEGWSAVR
jgi:hypothetical protein